jgi:predicted metal-binding membrane protein
MLWIRGLACAPTVRYSVRMPGGSSAAPRSPSRPRQPTKGLPVGVLAVCVVAWVGLLTLMSAQQDMGSPWAMPMSADWSPTQALLMLTMWVVMMVAMMLPSAYPMLAAYDRAVRADSGGQRWSVAAFAIGYLVCWGLFATVATGLQWWLLARSSIDSMGVLVHPWAASLVLIVAGVYQLTPTKRTMLGSCRAPMGFLATEWRDGRSGAFRMGVAHGRACLGCCWAVMLLLFVLGVMNLWWVVAIAAFVALEKLTRSSVVPRVAGAVFIVAGVMVFLFSATV